MLKIGEENGNALLRTSLMSRGRVGQLPRVGWPWSHCAALGAVGASQGPLSPAFQAGSASPYSDRQHS